MPLTLKAACDAAIADKSLAPKNGETYCNFGLIKIMQLMGLAPLSGRANQMIIAMGAEWNAVTAGRAVALAKAGKLCVAGLAGDKHGHVAVVYPADMEFSGSRKKNVPMVANVGNKNGMMKASGAFPSDPLYFAYPYEDHRG
jgi:hypothetical protein